jgi:SHS2 domain-containing protein
VLLLEVNIVKNDKESFIFVNFIEDLLIVLDQSRFLFAWSKIEISEAYRLTCSL